MQAQIRTQKDIVKGQKPAKAQPKATTEPTQAPAEPAVIPAPKTDLEVATARLEELKYKSQTAVSFKDKQAFLKL